MTPSGTLYSITPVLNPTVKTGGRVRPASGFNTDQVVLLLALTQDQHLSLDRF